MDLGTTGSILSFALKLEKQLSAFYDRYASELSNADVKEAFVEIQKIQKKRERVLSRFRRENVTEMILEPIHEFESDEFELVIFLEAPQDDSSLIASAIKIEENTQSFFLRASEKTKFLPEVSEEFKRISDKAGSQIALLKSIL
jgi:rubrerythrin